MMPSCVMTVDSFADHMRQKITTWKPDSLHLGADFALFEFNYKYQMQAAITNLKQYASYYGYNYWTDDKDRMVVVNAKTC